MGRRVSLRSWMKETLIVLALGAFIALSAASAFSEPQDALSDPSAGLGAFLRESLQMEALDDDPTTRYFAVPFDLNGDGDDASIVYVTGNRWCGSGGCTTLVLDRDGPGYRMVSRIRVTPSPVRVLDTGSEGWQSLAVPIAEVGPRRAYEAEVPFDGETYPENPTASAARRIDGEAPGVLVVPEMAIGDGTLLYLP
jgi:hypothetical protein